jgi:lipopolysaccharide export system permease protein
MIGSTIHRMIFLELLKAFALSLVTLTGMFLLAGMVQEASQRGLSPGQIVMAIPLLIPNTLPFTIPATTLFAVCLVYGRMSSDNEVLVMKAAGVNTMRLLKPAILLGVLTSAFTGAMYYHVIPRSQTQLRDRLMEDAESVLYGMLKRERCLRHPKMPYVIFVKDIQGRHMLDVVFKHREKVGDPHDPAKVTYKGYDMVARAKQAELRVDRKTNKIVIDMEQATFYGDKNKVFASNDQTKMEMDLPDSLFGTATKDRPSSQTWEELFQRRDELRAEARRLRELRDADQKTLDLAPPGPDRDNLADSVRNQAEQIKEAEKRARHVEAEMYLRPGLAVGCLCFVLVGCPVGIWAQKADYLSIFMVCFLPAVFVYYPIMLAGSGMAKNAKLPMSVGMFAADMIMGAVALLLIWRLMRR